MLSRFVLLLILQSALAWPAAGGAHPEDELVEEVSYDGTDAPAPNGTVLSGAAPTAPPQQQEAEQQQAAQEQAVAQQAAEQQQAAREQAAPQPTPTSSPPPPTPVVTSSLAPLPPPKALGTECFRPCMPEGSWCGRCAGAASACTPSDVFVSGRQYCGPGLVCRRESDWKMHCLPALPPAPPGPSTPAPTASAATASAVPAAAAAVEAAGATGVDVPVFPPVHSPPPAVSPGRLPPPPTDAKAAAAWLAASSYDEAQPHTPQADVPGLPVPRAEEVQFRSDSARAKLPTPPPFGTTLYTCVSHRKVVADRARDSATAECMGWCRRDALSHCDWCKCRACEWCGDDSPPSPPPSLQLPPPPPAPPPVLALYPSEDRYGPCAFDWAVMMQVCAQRRHYTVI